MLCRRRNQSLTFRLIIMWGWLSRLYSQHVSFLLFCSHFSPDLFFCIQFHLPLPFSSCLSSHCTHLPLQSYCLLLYVSPHLQTTFPESHSSTWLCDGVCIALQNCCFASQGVWWLSVCQTKRESHRCSWHRQQATLSYWSCSYSKIISSRALKDKTLTNESLFCCNIMHSVHSFLTRNSKGKLSFMCRNLVLH